MNAVARYYGLPVISLRNSIPPVIESGGVYSGYPLGNILRAQGGSFLLWLPLSNITRRVGVPLVSKDSVLQHFLVPPLPLSSTFPL